MAGEIIKITRNDIEKLRPLATNSELSKAVSRGINYALKRARTQMKKAVREEYNLPAGSVVASNNDGALQITSARQGKPVGTVRADIGAESLAHFRPTWYRDVYGSNEKGGAGGGHIKSSKRGAQYEHRKSDRNTSKSGVYVEIVKGRGKQCIPGAFMIFKGQSAIVMARGEYQGTGKSHDFKFAKPRLPINKLNAKSVYWGVMHPISIVKWLPGAKDDYIKEAERQIILLTK